MNRNTFTHWLILGAFAAAILPGCNDLTKRPASSPAVTLAPATAAKMTTTTTTCATCANSSPSKVAATPPTVVPANSAGACTPVPKPVALVTVGGTWTKGAPIAPPAVVSPTVAPPAVAAGGQAAATCYWQSPEPQVAEAPRQNPSARLEFVNDRAAGVLLPPIAEQPVPAQARTAFPRAEPAPVRKSFVDPTAAPCFAHATDYSWITGQVEYSRNGKEWRLRYASVDETDQYGGRVVLIENHHLSLLQDGQYVRVQGYVVNPDTAGQGPVNYRIESFQTLQNHNETEAVAVP
jgi:hypothetical protein